MLPGLSSSRRLFAEIAAGGSVSAPVLRGTAEYYSSGSRVTGSFSAGAADRLLVAIAYARSGSDNTGSLMTVTGGDLTWTKHHHNSNNNAKTGVAVWTAVSADTSSMTVTISLSSGSMTHSVLHIVEAEGADTSSPAGANGTVMSNAGQTITDPEITLSGTTAATSLVLGLLFMDGSGTRQSDATSPFTELHERGSHPFNRVDYYVGSRSTIPWTGTAVNWLTAGIGIEILAA